jgi:hypothetical protein
MRLCEHPDFDQAIQRAADHHQVRGLRPAIVEKDYYVTEALRHVAAVAGDHVIFKGGTSLSKGWGLIDRFSEDIDLFLDPRTFAPPLGGQRLDRELKHLRDAVLAFRRFGMSRRKARPSAAAAVATASRIRSVSVALAKCGIRCCSRLASPAAASPPWFDTSPPTSPSSSPRRTLRSVPTTSSRSR